jgi:2-methylcitrate dehydratase PrpD
MELTRLLASHIVETRYDNLPKEEVEAAKPSIFDTLGVMFPPTTLEKGCLTMYELVREAGGKEESTMIGFGGRAPCWMAAFVNGSLAHPMDFDDVTNDMTHHPTSNILAPALAMAERVGGVSGKDFTTAAALGSDIGIRLSAALRKPDWLVAYPWFHTIFGIFDAATSAAKVSRLSDEAMINALGLALHQAVGITEAIIDPASDIRAIRDGFTAKSGVIAALMAGKEIATCKDAVEKLFKVYYGGEYDPGIVISELGQRFSGTEVCLKPWPACRELHGYIQACQQIMKEHGIKPDQVAEVVATVGQFTANHCCEPIAMKRSPTTSIDARFSLPFVVVVALIKGDVKIADFLPEALKGAKVLEMANRVNYKFDPAIKTMVSTQTEIKTKDGKSFVVRPETMRGSTADPLSVEELIAKFRDCARYVRKPMAPDKLETLISKLLELEKVDDMKEVTDLLH